MKAEGIEGPNRNSTSGLMMASYNSELAMVLLGREPEPEVEAVLAFMNLGALQSEVGHLDMLENEVGRLCDEYAWWKLTRRCWNTHVLAAAAIGTKGEMWSLNQPRNGTRSLELEVIDKKLMEQLRFDDSFKTEMYVMVE
ncbi:hypothetical protein Tco_0891445 [Tanacetum coccineum]|uniref:Uncharacterized protein n=1 Tax=Tanacetum coccineum TaxID=301880 RepID=A0ABQ5C664_9ASTR